MGVLDPGLERLRQQLVEEIQASEARTARRFEAIDGRFAAIEEGTARQFEALGARIDATAVETRHHFDVVAEALRSTIVVVAEGLAALDEKTERFRGEVREEFTKIDRRFLHLEARVSSALDRR